MSEQQRDASKWKTTPTAPPRPPRWHLPDRRQSDNFVLEINRGDHTSRYEIGVSPPGGPIGEFFVCAGVKQGSPHFWDLHAGSFMLSLLLQIGVPIEDIRAAIGGSVWAYAIDKALELRGETPVPAPSDAEWRREDGTCRECGVGEGSEHRVTCAAHSDRPVAVLP